MNKTLILLMIIIFASGILGYTGIVEEAAVIAKVIFFLFLGLFAGILFPSGKSLSK